MFSRVKHKSNTTSLFFKVKHYSTVCIGHIVSTHFYVQGHLDGFYTVDTVKATAMNTGNKHSPNSSKFNEQKRYLSIC